MTLEETENKTETIVEPQTIVEPPIPTPPARCDLLIGKIPVDVVEPLLKELSLLNKQNETWWDKNVDTRMTEFEEWIGNPASQSKVIVRKHVAISNHKSILDCGCGLCSEYIGYKNDGVDIEYIGLDNCEKLVDLSVKKGINVKHGSIEKIPLPDNTADVSFTRHVLEHIFGYEKAITEMIRVASKEAIVVFFIPPKDSVPAASDFFKFDVVEEIWHNQYQKAQLEWFISANPKVASIAWTDLPELNESILHIILKQPELEPVSLEPIPSEKKELI